VPEPARSFARNFEQQGSYVDADDATQRADLIGELQHGLSGSTAQVHDDFGAARSESFDRTKAEGRELSIQGFADLSPSLSRESVRQSMP